MKLKHGKNPPKLKLEGDPELTIDLALYREKEKSSFKYLFEKRIDNIETEHKTDLKVPKRLRNIHPLIRSAKSELERKKTSGYMRDGNLIRPYSSCLSISVQYKNSGRFLRIIETFILLLEKRGHSISTCDHKYSILTMDGEKFEIKFREKCIRKDDPDSSWGGTFLEPTGKLSIRIRVKYNDKQWIDGYTLLEDRLADIIAYLEIQTVEIKIEKEKNRKRNEEAAYQRKLEALEFSRLQWEEAKQKELVGDAVKWDQWMKLTNYIKYIKKLDVDDPKVVDWLSWADTIAHVNDPLGKGLVLYTDSYSFNEEKVRIELGLA